MENFFKVLFLFATVNCALLMRKKTAVIPSESFSFQAQRFNSLSYFSLKNEKINFPLSNRRADLLIAAEWAAVKFCDFQADFFGDEAARRTGGKKIMMTQNFFIVFCTLQYILFFVVMSDERDAFAR